MRLNEIISCLVISTFQFNHSLQHIQCSFIFNKCARAIDLLVQYVTLDDIQYREPNYNNI